MNLDDTAEILLRPKYTLRSCVLSFILGVILGAGVTAILLLDLLRASTIGR